MKNPAFTLFYVLLCAAFAFAQTNIENKQKEPVSLAELAKQPACGSQHIAQLDDAVKTQPRNTDLYLQRADCLNRTKNPVFLKDILTIIDLNPKFDISLYLALNNLVLGKQPAESQANLKYLTAATSNHWYLSALRSAFKIDSKDFQGATDYWIKVIVSTPLVGSPELWRSGYEIVKSANDKEIFVFYDRIFNAAQARQQKLSVKLKELPPKSPEYKEVRSDINQLGKQLQNLSLRWAKLAAKLGNTQMESTALEKMVTVEPRWQSYAYRVSYYKSNGNTQNTFPDEVRSINLQIESNLDELKHADSQAQQSSLNSYFCDLYSSLGDLYFRNGQYVKAISNYEKAKPFYRYKNVLDSKINAAVKKLNVPSQ